MKNMNDRELEMLMKAIDTEAVPPEGLKERLLCRVMGSEHSEGPVLAPFERFVFEKPLRTACLISIPISGTLWALLGSGFAKLLSGIIG